MVLRISDALSSFYIVDPEFSWSIESTSTNLDLEWDVLPSQVGSLPKIIPGRRVLVEVVSRSGSTWEVVPHMINGNYTIVDVSVDRLMRHLRYAVSLKGGV